MFSARILSTLGILAFTSPLKSRNSCLFSGAGAMSGPPSLRPLTSKWLVQERLGLGHPP